MKYDENLEMYVVEIDGLIFTSEDEPSDNFEKEMQPIADNYRKNLTSIIDFMLPDLQALYGQIDRNTVKEKLGQPLIDYDNGRVDYCEQSFDCTHIFSFEFLDDEFKDLHYFSIDG